MSLSKNLYNIFADIVGEKNINTSDVILDAYTFNWLSEFQKDCAPSKYLNNRPLAVILPANTDEVQLIVRTCNHHGIKYKASSTAYGSHAFSLEEDVIHIDLKRMNKIIELDPKNRVAVVEPYVPWAQLTAEALKLGLFCTPHQAGSQASALANVTSGWGMNVMGNHGGHNARNCLGVEWILPDGELIRVGADNGWFCGDGPGPSLRGIMRGHVGALGGMGIFTKCAIKLHQWPGPKKVATQPGGMFSAYKIKEAIPNSRAFMVDTPTYEALSDFLYQLGDAEIAYSIIRCGGPEHFFALAAGAISNQMYLDLCESGLINAAAEEFNHPVLVWLVGNSKEEYQYQLKVFNQIVEDTGAVIPDVINLSPFKELMEEEIPVVLIGNDTHMCHHAGGFVISAGYMGTADSVVSHMGIPTEQLKTKYIERGGILADGADSTYHNSFDNNSYIYMELEFHYDAADPNSVNESRRCIAEERDNRREEKEGFEVQDIALCVGDANMSIHDRFELLGPLYGNFHVWQEKIKRAFDPMDTADRSTYGIGLRAKDLDI